MSTPPYPTSGRPPAERRVLEQLQKQQQSGRRTLPKPAATSGVQADSLRRSRLFGAAPSRHQDNSRLLQEILDEFPEIDATTVSVLLEMHSNMREPVVQRLEEVYRRPGKAPQKRHSFPASSPRELGRKPPPAHVATVGARKSRPFSVDRVDEDDDDATAAFIDGLERMSADGARRSVERRTSRSSTPPVSPRASRSFNSSSSTSRRASSPTRGPRGARASRRSRDADGSGSDAVGGGGRARREERAADPLLPPWGQDISPRPRGDAVPPVMLAPHAIRSRANERTPRGGASPILGASVVAEPAVVRLRARPPTPGTVLLHDDESASSSTGSSLTRGSPAPSSARSSERPGSAASHTSRGDVDSASRDGSARSAAAVMRNAAGSGRAPRGGVVADTLPMSRRQRATRSVRELGNAVREKARQYRENWSEEGELDEMEETRGEDRRGMAAGGDRDDGGVEANDGSEDASARTVGAQELLILRGDAEDGISAVDSDNGVAAGYVRVEKTMLQRLIRKINMAERTLHELRTERSEKVVQLVSAVNDVSSSLVSYDVRQQRRFEHLTERFTGNNDSIERLTNDMWTIRRMLHDYETRRSRRFWRMLGMLLLDSLAYVGLILVWLCTSVYNLFARQRRAVARLFVTPCDDDVAQVVEVDDDDFAMQSEQVEEDDDGYIEDDDDEYDSENGTRPVGGVLEGAARRRRRSHADVSKEAIG